MGLKRFLKHRRMHRRKRVFGIGLQRTGTATLHRAFGMLDLQSIHFFPSYIYARPEDVLVDKIADFRLFDRYDAFSDNPTPFLFRQLDAWYPGSRFVLTVRDTPSWLASVEWLFSKGREKWKWGPWEHYVHQRLYGFRDSAFSARVARDVYERHNDSVREYFEKRTADLLIIDWHATGDWEALCRFLGKPAPSAPIPHLNQRTTESTRAP